MVRTGQRAIERGSYSDSVFCLAEVTRQTGRRLFFLAEMTGQSQPDCHGHGSVVPKSTVSSGDLPVYPKAIHGLFPIG